MKNVERDVIVQCAQLSLEEDMAELALIRLQRALAAVEPIDWSRQPEPMVDYRGGQGREHEFEPGFVSRRRFF